MAALTASHYTPGLLHASPRVLAAALSLSSVARASEPPKKITPGKAAAWSLLCPGCGYFYLEQPGTAAAFLAPAVAMGGTGIVLLLDKPELGNQEDPALEADDPIALQLLLATQNLWFYGMFASYRDGQAIRPDLVYRVPRSHETLGDLASAPFRPSVLARPWVWAGVPLAVGGAIGLAVLLGSASEDDRSRTLFDAGDVNFLGRRYDKGPGIALGELYYAALFVPVGVGEEALFRGVLQPALSERIGTTQGWVLSSFIFGAAHAPNFTGESPGTAAAAIAYITAAGGYLGLASMRTSGGLATPVAIHFWYDFLISTVAFVADPEHQPFVARFGAPF